MGNFGGAPTRGYFFQQNQQWNSDHGYATCSEINKSSGNGEGHLENDMKAIPHTGSANEPASSSGYDYVTDTYWVPDQNIQVMQAGIGSDVLNYGNQILNFGSVLLGVSETGTQVLRHHNGPQRVGRLLNKGTRETAGFLKKVVKYSNTWGKRVGNAGMILSTISYIDEAMEPGDVSTATNVNFWLSAGLYTAAYLTIGTFAAPWVAGAALLYGAAELVSYGYNGKTLEQNLIGP